MNGAWDFIIKVGELMIACTAVGLTLTGIARAGRERIIKMMTDHHEKAMAAIRDNHLEAMRAVETQRRDSDSELESVRKSVGESIAALRQQITDLGFFIRDGYVRREDLNVLGDKLEARFLRIETEIRNRQNDGRPPQTAR